MSTGIVIVDGRHDRCPPPTTATTSCGSNAANQHKGSSKILQKRWVCDVCKVKWFLDFKEACAHEARCGVIDSDAGGSPSSSSLSSSSSSSVEVVEPAVGMGRDREASLISADSNDGSRSINNASSTSSHKRGGGAVKSDEPSAEKISAVIAAARAKVAAKNGRNSNNANDKAKQQSKGGTPAAAAAIVDLGDNEAESNASSSSSSSTTSSGGKRKKNVKAGEGTSSSTQPSDAAPDNNDGASNRRKSKRLRDATSKPPPLKDSMLQSSNIAKSNDAKAKKSKTASKPEKSSTSEKLLTKSNKSSSKKKKAAEKGATGGKLASIFLPKKNPAAASAALKDPKKNKRVVVPPGVTEEEYEEHVTAEKLAEQKKKEHASRPPGVTEEEYEEHVAAEKEVAKQRKKRGVQASVEEGKSKQPKQNKKSKSGAKGKKVLVHIGSSSEESDGDDSSDEEFSDEPQPKKKKKNFLSKDVLGENSAADFFAKRKKARAEERERQKKREELRLQRLNEKQAGSAKDAREIDVKKSAPSSLLGRSADRSSALSSAMDAEGKRDNSIPAVRFPCPSHVISNDTDASSLEMGLESTLNGTSLQLLRKTPRYQYLKPDLPCSNDACDIPTHTSFLTDSDNIASLERNTTSDLLSSVFHHRKEAKKNKALPSNNQLWADKYSMKAIPNDVLGAENKEASQKLLDFIDEWKVRRHKSVQVMGQLKRKKKRRKKSSYGYDSDDSFLDDGNGGLENIFLITGPTGTGKTRLVHAAAEQLECAVIEINSSEQRSGAALKRAIQETTQSHSSLAMSRKNMQGKKSVNGFFGGGDAAEASDVEDSDSCFDESDAESVRESHSLTVILIDEVDLLFDEDAAFWPALTQLSQKAKCPIVLTATSAPTELGNLRSKSIALVRPSPGECGMWMTEVAESERMLFKDDVEGEERSRLLSLIAEACGCDVRKILNEMLLFHCFKETREQKSPLRKSVTQKIDMNEFGLRPNANGSSPSVLVDDKPLILGVEPKKVPKNRHTLITITGKNFSSSDLSIGGRECSHFRVINNTKILAVCPPCALPDGVSEKAIYEGEMGVDCFSCKYAEVVVRRKCSNGLVLDSSSLLGLESCDRPDPESNVWNIEYDIQLRDGAHQESMSREEFIRRAKARKRAEEAAVAESEGFLSSDGDDEFRENPKLTPSSPQDDQDPNIDRDSALKELPKEEEPEMEEIKCVDPQVMLDEALAKMMDTSEGALATEAAPSSHDFSMSLLEASSFADEMGRLSDAILLEDSFSTLAIPSLSGSVEGLGLQGTVSSCTTEGNREDFSGIKKDKLCKAMNKKPPSFETLYSTGANECGFFFGSSNSYMTNINRRRDRLLLSYSESHSRGLGLLDQNCLQSEENGDNSNTGLESEEETLDSSSFVQLQSRAVCSEDDILLNSQASPAFRLLPALLLQGLGMACKHGFTRNMTPLLHLRRSQVATTALGIMHDALADCNLWYAGLRHDDENEAVQRNHVWLMPDLVLDHPLSLDYLPCVRAIAHFESKARQRMEEMTNENDETNRGGRRRTRTSNRKNYRRHYLDECAAGKDDIDVKSLELILSAGSVLGCGKAN